MAPRVCTLLRITVRNPSARDCSSRSDAQGNICNPGAGGHAQRAPDRHGIGTVSAHPPQRRGDDAVHVLYCGAVFVTQRCVQELERPGRIEVRRRDS